MGTTSEKLTYLNETKQELKQKINNLGGSIDNNTTFRNYANQLQNVYDNLPKTEYQEGTEVNLGKTIKGKLDYENGVVGIGQSSQDSTTGKNLLKPYENVETVNGITCTYNSADQTYSFNGTCTTNNTVFRVADNDITFTRNLTKISAFLVGGSVTSYCTLRSFDANYSFSTNLDLLNLTNLNPVISATSNDDYTASRYGINIRFNAGSVANNFRIKLMIANNSDTSYEEYTGGYASPSPNWEQEIEYVRGRNILNPELLNVFAQDKYISTLNFNSKGTITVKPLSTYTISFDRFAGDGRIYEYDENDTLQNTINLYPSATPKYLTFTTTANTKRIGFYAAIDTNGGVTIENAKPMLCEGAEHRAYLPYNTIEEVVGGKNLAHIELEGKYREFRYGSIQTNADFNGYIASVKPNTSYIANGNGLSDNPGRVSNLCFFDNQMTYIDGNAYNSTDKTFTTPNNCYYVTTAVHNQITNFQIEQGSTATTYEPYITPTSYQLSLGDKKLYDECYIVGSPDNWKYVDWHEKIMLKDLSWIRNATGTSGKYRYYTVGVSSTIEKTTGNNQQTTKGLYSNILKETNADQNFLLLQGICSSPNGQLYVYIQSVSEEEDTTALINLLTSTNAYAVIPLAQAKETPITDETLISQLNAWYNAHSNNGTTIITSNGDLPMIIKVRGLKGE